jgi:hypothetical protein
MRCYKPYTMMIIIIFSFLSGAGTAADAAPKDDAYQFMITFLLSDPENLTSSRKDETTGEPIAWDLVYMPSANVTGSITPGNRTLNIDGIGYHDHFWGRFALSDPQITWAEASEPGDGFSLTLGEIQGDERNAFLGIKSEPLRNPYEIISN